MNDRTQNVFNPGLYHLTSAGATTWYGFAEKIAEIAEKQIKKWHLKIREIEAISTEEYPIPAKRPIKKSS